MTPSAFNHCHHYASVATSNRRVRYLRIRTHQPRCRTASNHCCEAGRSGPNPFNADARRRGFALAVVAFFLRFYVTRKEAK